MATRKSIPVSYRETFQSRSPYLIIFDLQESKNKLVDAITNNNVEERVREAFNQYDKDKSGTLSREEFSSFANDLLNIIREGMDSAELLEKFTPKHFTETMFAKLDTNHNGKISYNEFREVLKNI